MSLEAIEPSLAVVDRWLDRREGTVSSLRGALEALVERRLIAWARIASVAAIDEARAELRDRGVEHLGAHMSAHVRESAIAAPSGVPVPAEAATSAVDLLRRLTQAHGAEAYEIVEQAFRRSIAKFGARFVATHARAAIDETMGPMHSTVVAADLLSMLERLDTPYLESLTFSLETMHDWGVVAARTAESREKTRPTAKRSPRALSSPKRRA